ncbi:choice-of-anchor M domain-containing protein [Streptomyces sp. NPDC048290]|uniref:choice-of-anchor M domain-containing protein n=1 Tax=Streptomyces sp. NPDC048290 TaxID=3155811 RepID=UPI0034444767
MRSARDSGVRNRIAVGCALGTALVLSPVAATAVGAPEAGPTPAATHQAPVPAPAIDVDDTRLTPVPDDPAYAFLGDPGTPVWEADEPEAGAGLTLTAVEGPGALVVHRTADDGQAPEVLAHSDRAGGFPEDGYPIPPRETGTSTSTSTGTGTGTGTGTDEPSDARWSFTAPGTYRLTLAEASAEDDPVRRTTILTAQVGTRPPVRPSPLPSPATGPVPALTPVPSLAGRAPALAARPSAARAVEAPAPARAASGQAATERKVLGAGHVDIAARVVDGRLQMQVKDGTVAGKTTWREPSSVVFHVKPAAKKQIPAGDSLAFLGRAGDPVWLLDQVQQEGLLWPGWSTDNIGTGALEGGVKFGLTKARGPGGFALYTYDGLSGATVLFDSADGVPDHIDVPANTHAHGGWAFRGEGVHRLTVSMAGTLANGSASADTETLTFVVGDSTDPDSVSPSGDGPGSAGTPTGADGTSGSGATAPASGAADGAAGQSTGASGSMASTGAGDAVLMGGGAVALAAAGAALVGLNRRRVRRRDGGRA